jgi:hypothetical protein
MICFIVQKPSTFTSVSLLDNSLMHTAISLWCHDIMYIISWIVSGTVSLFHNGLFEDNPGGGREISLVMCSRMSCD